MLLAVIAAAFIAAWATPGPSTNPGVQGCSATITLSAGAVSANSLAPSCVNNPVGNVAANTTWTSSSANYLTATSNSNYIIQTVGGGVGRDVEVTTWMRQGYVYERLDNNGTALYFFHDGQQTNGYLEAGIVTGLNQNSYPSGTYYKLYVNSNLISTIGTSGSLCSCGYTSSATDGQTFTFGVKGFDVYIKYGGTQFATWKQQDYQMSVGGVALKASTLAGNGFRNITITPFSPQALFSDYQHNQIDLRDFGLRSTQTTGSITAGQNTLTVANAAGFQVNDLIVVEIGQEAGLGQRGTIGVGGQWPLLSYANSTAMNADTGQPQYTFAWLNDGTGDTYEWSGTATPWSAVTQYNGNEFVLSGGNIYQCQVANINSQPPNSNWSLIGPALTWTKVSTTVTCPFCTAGEYYVEKAVPISLTARITNIASNVLTLSNPDGTSLSGQCTSGGTGACATVSGANVYLDNELILNDLTQQPRTDNVAGLNFTPIVPPNLSLVFPAGTYAFAGYIEAPNHPNWIIKGAGQKQTTLYSPKGTYGAGLLAEFSNGMTIRDLTIQENAGLQEFGLAYGTTLVPLPPASNVSEYDASGKILTSTIEGIGGVNITQTSIVVYFQTGGITYQLSDYSSAVNVTINNNFSNSFQCTMTNYCWGYNLTANFNFSSPNYTQWQFGFITAYGGGCQNCSAIGSNMIPGLTMFGGTNATQIINYTGTNAAMESNGSGGWTITNPTITINTGGTVSGLWTPGQGVIIVDQNTGVGTSGQAATITNATITQTGYMDSSNDVEIGIRINSPVPNITINGGTYTAPNYASPSTLVGPQGIISQGNNTTVNNFKACGTVSGPIAWNNANIGLFANSGNIVTNSQATSISSPTGAIGDHGNTSC